MKVALVQSRITWEDKAANFTNVLDMLDSVSFPGPGLIVLPELFATGFTMNAESIAEDDLGITETFLIELAKEKGVHVIGGVAKRQSSESKPSNCSVIAAPDGGIVCRYRKTHPFSYGEEDQNYSRGNQIFTETIQGIKVSPSICYDLRFPEVFRIGAKSGAEVFAVIANWPEKRNQHWITLLQARAIENQAYVIGVNRCGEDPTLAYAGSTMLVDYLGEIVADAGTQPGVIEATLDMESLREWREIFPALKDRHEDDLSSA